MEINQYHRRLLRTRAVEMAQLVFAPDEQALGFKVRTVDVAVVMRNLDHDAVSFHTMAHVNLGDKIPRAMINFYPRGREEQAAYLVTVTESILRQIAKAQGRSDDLCELFGEKLEINLNYIASLKLTRGLAERFFYCLMDSGFQFVERFDVDHNGLGDNRVCYA